MRRVPQSMHLSFPGIKRIFSRAPAGRDSAFGACMARSRAHARDGRGRCARRRAYSARCFGASRRWCTSRGRGNEKRCCTARSAVGAGTSVLQMVFVVQPGHCGTVSPRADPARGPEAAHEVPEAARGQRSAARLIGARTRSSLSAPRVKKGSARFERPVRGSSPRDRASEGVDWLGCEGLPRAGSGRRIQPGVGRGQNWGEELEQALEVDSDPRDPAPAAERCWDDMDRSSLLRVFAIALGTTNFPMLFPHDLPRARSSSALRTCACAAPPARVPGPRSR